MNLSVELEGYSDERARHRVASIGRIMQRIFLRAERDAIPSWLAADRLAEERITAIGRLPRA